MEVTKGITQMESTAKLLKLIAHNLCFKLSVHRDSNSLRRSKFGGIEIFEMMVDDDGDLQEETVLIVTDSFISSVEFAEAQLVIVGNEAHFYEPGSKKPMPLKAISNYFAIENLDLVINKFL